RAYLRHLFMAKEMLGPILLTHHNLTFYQQLMAEAQRQLAAGSYLAWLQEQRRLQAA
ncbi:MAG: tRNA guanosine(34) transglycosylase Tgt, partial [Planctomycetales bacterium]|nr:tRNA guanosine(34) transglycosylase Tgt [Planctomycetales bacterium]